MFGKEEGKHSCRNAKKYCIRPTASVVIAGLPLRQLAGKVVAYVYNLWENFLHRAQVNEKGRQPLQCRKGRGYLFSCQAIFWQQGGEIIHIL